MQLIRADEIRDIHNRKKTYQQKGIDAVINRCYTKIRSNVKANPRSSSCVLEIPEYLFGYPLYDLTECVLSTKRHLESNGYRVSYFFPRMLVASWADAIATGSTPINKSAMNFKKSGKAVLSLV